MRKLVFADEAGNFDFNRKHGATRYFVLCTVVLDSCDIGNDLLTLRRDMAWNGLSDVGPLHATTDSQAVRDQIFNLIKKERFRVDATILEKSKAAPQTRISDIRFYQYAWFYHFKHIASKIINPGDELFVFASSIGTKKKYGAFRAAIHDVMLQSVKNITWKTAFWPSMCDPCLQIADYCTWAIQRKWENKDVRSYALIADKIFTDYDLWSIGKKHYY